MYFIYSFINLCVGISSPIFYCMLLARIGNTARPIIHQNHSEHPAVIWVVLVSPITKTNFSPFHSMVSHFQVVGQFWDKWTKWPNNDLQHYKVKNIQYPMCFYITLPQFQNAVHLALSAIFEFQINFGTSKYIQCLPNALEHHKVTGTRYVTCWGHYPWRGMEVSRCFDAKMIP